MAFTDCGRAGASRVLTVYPVRVTYSAVTKAIPSSVEPDQLHLTSMAEQVNVQDAKTRLSELLQRVQNGEEITIAKYGKPIARLVAVDELPPRQLGFLHGFSLDDSFFEPLPEEELRLWEGR